MKKYVHPHLEMIRMSAIAIATSDIIRTSGQETEIVGDGAGIMPSAWESKLLGH